MPSGRTHAIAGALAGGAMMVASQGPPSPILVLAGALGGLLPDVDHRHSLLGRYFFLWLLFKHRGFTHSLLAWGIATILGLTFLGNDWGLGMSAGYLSHLVLDFRVPWMWPNKRRKKRWK